MIAPAAVANCIDPAWCRNRFPVHVARRPASRGAARCAPIVGRLAHLAWLVVGLFVLAPVTAFAGGTCMLHPDAFRLQSDTVRWLIRIGPGAECIQGLRWSTLMIDGIFVTEQPKLGKLILSGPAFRYVSAPGARGADSFKLRIDGSSLRVKGTSIIEVSVNVE